MISKYNNNYISTGNQLKLMKVSLNNPIYPGANFPYPLLYSI